MNSSSSAGTLPTINHVLKMVESMRTDLHQIHSRMNLLERSIAEIRNHQLKKKVKIIIKIRILNLNTKSSMPESKILELKYPKWWPIAEISPAWLLFMIIWPFIALRIMQTIQRKKWSCSVNINYITDYHEGCIHF